MARFYWVFDGFVEPEHYRDYRGPENGLQPTAIREELRAHLEKTLQETEEKVGRPTSNVGPHTSNIG